MNQNIVLYVLPVADECFSHIVKVKDKGVRLPQGRRKDDALEVHRVLEPTYERWSITLSFGCLNTNLCRCQFTAALNSEIFPNSCLSETLTR